MKKFNILMATSAVALLATACVKPAHDTQAIYTDGTQPVYSGTTTESVVFQDAQPTIYEPTGGTVYEEIQPDNTVITTGAIGQSIGGTATYGGTTTYPDPYANGGTTTPVYNDSYVNQPIITDYPVATNTSPVTTGQGGGIHLQIAALKNYATAEDYKNRLSLAPGLSAYVQRGSMNKVIVTGIPSVAEANRLKETRFPGAFIVQGGTSGGYTPAVQPSYDTTNGGAYNVNNPYGTPSSSRSTSGNYSAIGVQIGAFGSRGKAQSVANSQGGQYPATVKKVGQYYKVILTGFSSRSAAKAYAGRIGGFVVSTY